MASDRIGDSLARRADGELVIEALAVWTATRSAVIAEAVDTLSEGALASWAAPRSRRPEGFQASWLRVVGDPIGRGWAVAHLDELLPGDDPAARASALAIRLRALGASGADPRAGLAVARRLAGGDPQFGYFEVARAAEEVLVESRDERSRGVLAGLSTDDEELAAIVARLLARPPLGRPPTRRELDRFAIVTAPRGAAGLDIDALLAQVYAHPEDDEPRLVLADALQGQGDPRGELIALQLAAPASATDHEARLRRIDALIKACGADWLGDLAGIAYRAQFQRGFPARLELAKTFRIGIGDWNRLCEHPMLSTIEELVPGNAPGAPYGSLVTSPAMTSLRRIEVFDRDTMTALSSTDAKLEHVACPRLKRGSGNYVAGLVRSVLPSCLRRPTITSIGIALGGFEALEASGLLERLTSVTLGDHQLDRILASWSRLPARCELVAKRTAGLEECIGLRVAWLGDLRIARRAGEVVCHAWGELQIHALIASFGTLPVLDRLIVAGATPQQASALGDLVAERGIELELPPAPIRSGYLTLGRA